jgi:hypothetical protein
VHGAPGSSFAYDRELGLVARASLRSAIAEDAGAGAAKLTVLRVYVRCYHDKQSFEQPFERRFGASARRVVAYYAVSGGEIHLRAVTCANVHAFLGGRHTVYTAAAFAILLHEALHRQGLWNERLTTCFANEAVRWGALRYGFSERQALRARNLAFTYTRVYSPPSYFMGRPDCLLLTRRHDWPAFTKPG